MAELPIVISKAGRAARTPNELWQALLADVASTNPGYTANLPGSLIEDVSSTDVAALVLCDSAVTELVNSITPFGANDFLLSQLGEMLGVHQSDNTNTSVYVVFTGAPGYVVPPNFMVGDGTYTYRIRDGGAIGTNGQTSPLYAVAELSGSWAVPPGSVTLLVTSVPAIVGLEVSNPLSGVPGNLAQTSEDFRGEVMQANRAAGLGMPSFLKTQLANVNGVQARLISVQAAIQGGWKVIVGGGDIFEVAYAIYSGILDTSSLKGSTLNVTNITTAVNAVVTTNLDHHLAQGQTANINGVTGMLGINNVPLIVDVVDAKTFRTGFNSMLAGQYAAGGIVTPNVRNVTPSLFDYPDTYTVPYVQPPAQDVSISVSWATSLQNYVNEGAVKQLGAPALAQYVNSIPVGQSMSIYLLESTFKKSISSIIPGALLTRMVFSVSINGVGVLPTPGTGSIPGDPESYFLTDATGLEISISRAGT